MDDEARRGEEQVLYPKLLRSLEVARTTLAIAVAEESKRTLPTARRYFAETEGRIRDLVRTLRTCGTLHTADLAHCREALAALEAPIQGSIWGLRARSRAELLCRNLNEVLDRVQSEVRVK